LYCARRCKSIYTNETMVNALKTMGYASGAVAKAMLEIDRKDFIGRSEREYAYFDVPLPIGYGQTTSAPGIIARMLTLLDIREGMKVLEVGVGSGYQTALIAKLVGEKGSVVGVEIIPQLAGLAADNLRKYEFKNLSLVKASGANGYAPAAPYDRIVYSAAVRSVPSKAVEQLKDPGRLIAPVGETVQVLHLVEKKNGKAETTKLDLVVFVPLV
jgi:protein-L-isoaspartate(D-aspartate) O-methyltransferase